MPCPKQYINALKQIPSFSLRTQTFAVRMNGSAQDSDLEIDIYHTDEHHSDEGHTDEDIDAPPGKGAKPLSTPAECSLVAR